jgi:hypothetical protein
MKRTTLIAAILMMSVIVHAGDAIQTEIFFSKKIKLTQKTRVAVVPFELTVSWAASPSEAAVKKSVESKNTEKFELALLQSGVTVIERNKLDKVLAELSINQSGLTDENSMKVGKMLAADIIVTGNIPLWSYHDKIKKGFIEILIKGIVVETGEIAFKASFSTQIDTTNDEFRFQMAQLETKIYAIFGENMEKKVGRK